jgi:DNA ligase D
VANAWAVEVDGIEVRISSPDKPYFPDAGLTKRDIVEYVLAVGPGLLRALRDRPTTLERRPDGLAGEAFFAKRLPKGAPDFVRTARVAFPSGRTADSVVMDSLATIVWAVQLGTLTFHPWPVRSSDTDHPDELRFDLDPQPGTGWNEVVEVAEVLGWVSYPKTSGSRGLHVYVRIAPHWDFVQVRRGVIAVAREVERRVPDRATTAWWKEERGARVFLDYNQAARDRTIASAYSVRPLAAAPVSAPLHWNEVASVEAQGFTVRTMPERFASVGDAHAAIDDVAHDLTPALELALGDEQDGLGDLPYPPEFPKMPGEPLRVQPSRRAAP